MKVGIIGAGKVGFSMGRYLVENGIELTGYFSKSKESSLEASNFTKSKSYQKLADIVRDSEVLFITVPDDMIGVIWEQIKELNVSDKIFCHCSGVLSSKVFLNIADYGCYGYSIHPLLAVSDKYHSYKEFSSILFTIEGSKEKFNIMKELFEGCGNKVISIKPEDKIRYHGAAVLSSNLVLGLLETAVEELTNCGFTREDAFEALIPFMYKNVEHLKNQSIEESLTGPVERGDVSTVNKHMDKFEGDNREIYRLLSKKALNIAKRKNPQRDYVYLAEQINEK